ncbi:hypothetical protein [Minwuia thermotolerans]|nr:hypothetical protein [Minwuia thermotolerans]
MIRLAAAGDWWIDFGDGLRLRVRRASTGDLAAARLAAAMAADNHCDPPAREGAAAEMWAVALGQRLILDWEGVLGPDDEPAPADAANVAELLSYPDIAERFLDEIAAPWPGLPPAPALRLAATG